MARSCLEDVMISLTTFVQILDLSSYMRAYDETVEILRRFGGVRATAIRPKTFEPGVTTRFDPLYPRDAL